DLGDHVCADVEASPFDCGTAREAEQAGFHDVVVRVQPGTGLRIDRIEIDDTAATALFEMRQSGLHAPPCAPDDDIHRALEHFVSLLFEQYVRRQIGGVVDETIETTEFVDGTLDHRVDFAFDTDISRHTDRFGTNFFANLRRNLFDSFAIAAGDQQLGAILRQPAGNTQPQALGTARHDHHFVFQQPCHVFTS